MPTQKSVMIIAGEASGDLHGANLVREIKDKIDSVQFSGIGGHALKSQGVDVFLDSSALSVVGITEALVKLPTLLKAISTAKKRLKEIHPDLLILIDFPDFNLHIARFARRLGVPVLYYISPQIWAWRSGRVRKIKKRVNHMAVIFPFEAEFYEKHDVPVTFVGHPLMDRYEKICRSPMAKMEYPSRNVAFLPGSRDREVMKHLPVMIESAKLLVKKDPGLKFTVSCASSVHRTTIENIISDHGNPDYISISSNEIESILEESTLAVAVSGTVTLQVALCETPMVIIYKVSALSYWLGRMLINVDHIGLVNLVGGELIAPELIQDEASPGNIAETVFSMIKDPARMESVKRSLSDIRKKLGDPGASGRLAEIALEYL